MLSKDLLVTALNITEDYYEYKATFRLFGGENFIDLDLSELTDAAIVKIKEVFGIEESIEDIRKEIMSKIMEASRIESRNEEGKLK